MRSQMQIQRLVVCSIKVGRQAKGRVTKLSKWLVKSYKVSVEGMGRKVKFICCPETRKLTPTLAR